jgi:tricarballylate dehydrogenase
MGPRCPRERFNTGTMLEKAIDAGAQSTGHWGGCHASPQDLHAPRVGDLAVKDRMPRYTYPYSLMVNLDGKRFIDEGEEFFGLTYAKTEQAIRAQKEANTNRKHYYRRLG